MQQFHWAKQLVDVIQPRRSRPLLEPNLRLTKTQGISYTDSQAYPRADRIVRSISVVRDRFIGYREQDCGVRNDFVGADKKKPHPLRRKRVRLLQVLAHLVKHRCWYSQPRHMRKAWICSPTICASRRPLWTRQEWADQNRFRILTSVAFQLSCLGLGSRLGKKSLDA